MASRIDGVHTDPLLILTSLRYGVSRNPFRMTVQETSHDVSGSHFVRTDYIKRRKLTL